MMSRPKPTTVKPENQFLNLRLQRYVPPGMRTQVWRRRFVVGMVGGYLATLAAHALLRDQAFGLLSFFPGLFGVLCWGALVGATGAVADMPDEYADERQQLVRDRAYRLSFIYLAALVVLVALYVYWAVESRDWKRLSLNLPLPGRDWLDFGLWSALLVTLSLPSMVLGWAEPDLEPDLES